MYLKKYLERKKLTQAQFAKQVGVSQGAVCQWISGKSRITAERAKEIEEKTKKAIKRHELRPDLFSKAA